MSESFNIHRLGFLIRNDIISSYRSVLVASLTLMSIMLLNSMLNVGFDKGEGYFYQVWFGGMVIIWGSIAASDAFKELHDKTCNHEFLLLPASALEKTLSRLVFVTIALISYILVFTFVASLVVEAINELVFSRSNSLFRPFDPIVWKLIPHVIVMQSLFFLGAAWSRKGRWLKTTMVSTIIVIGLLIFAMIIFRIIFSQYFDGFHMSGNHSFELNAKSVYLANKDPIQIIWTSLKLLYFFVLPFFCWSVAWLRLRETEVSHGV